MTSVVSSQSAAAAESKESEDLPDSLRSHFIYVVSSNPLTGLAFVALGIIVLVALAGPLIVPYDPLASNAAMVLQPPSMLQRDPPEARQLRLDEEHVPLAMRKRLPSEPSEPGGRTVDPDHQAFGEPGGNRFCTGASSTT